MYSLYLVLKTKYLMQTLNKVRLPVSQLSFKNLSEPHQGLKTVLALI